MPNMLDGLSPADFGLPAKFPEFRATQRKALNLILDSNHRFMAHNAPVGSGKSLIAIAAAVMNGYRTAILTSTKGLQDQYMEDFAEIGLTNVKGRNNFQCTMERAETCEDGMHLQCPDTKPRQTDDLEPSRCPYRQQYEAAKSANLVITNYSYWCAIHRYSTGLGKFDLLVCDEAHDAPAEITSQLSVSITDSERVRLNTQWPKDPLYIKGWMEWAVKLLPVAEGEERRAAVLVHSGDSGLRDLKKWKALVVKLKRLSALRGEWCVDRDLSTRSGETGFRLDCVWPYAYSEEILFLNIPRVLLQSGTLVPRTLHLLGIKPGTYDYHPYASSFPIARWPVYVIPATKLNRHSTHEDYAALIQLMDSILDARLDRRVIIHTTSYARAQHILSRSRHRRYMLSHTNQSGEAMRAAQVFKAMPAPVILVTPSMTTGYDFAYDACECQIIVKAPYADLSTVLEKRRAESDRLYPAHQMAQTFTQICGRAMRASDDQCETFVLDGAVNEVYRRTPNLFPGYIRAVYKVIDQSQIPAPPPSLISQSREPQFSG